MKPGRIEKRIYILLSILMLAYLCLRAIYIPIVHDEACTFLRYIQTRNFLPPYAFKDANNHILNSALAVAATSLFGNSEFVLRSPNLLFAVVFFYFIFRLACLIDRPVIRWSFILTLLTAHYFIEFFAFCRGYGISMALLVAAIWYLYRYLQTEKTSMLLITLLLLFLAVSANLTLIITVILFFSMVLLNLLINKGPIKKRVLQFFLILILGILPVLMFAKLLFSMRSGGQLYYGNQEGFIEETVKSLLAALFDHSVSLLTYLVLVLFLILTAVNIYLLFKDRFQETIRSVHFVSYILLTGNIAAALLLNKLYHINYPEDRVGLYLFPFFFTSFYFTADKWFGKYHKKAICLLCLPALLFPLQFVKDISLEHARFWKDNQIPYRFFQKVAGAEKDFDGKIPTVSGYKLYQLCWYYYNFRNGGNYSLLQSNDFPNKDADFLIASERNYPEMFKDYQAVDHYEYNDLYLLKRKVILKKIIADSVINISTHGSVNDEYYNIWTTDSLEKLRDHSVYFLYDLVMDFPEKPFETRIIVVAEDKDNNKLRYDFLSLDWLKKDWSGKNNNFRNCLLAYRLPDNISRISTYIWNVEKRKFSIENGECRIYTLN
jgi:hypothetical protein